VESVLTDQLAAAQFRSLLASSAEGIITADLAGTILLANRRAETMFGYSSGELLGQSIHVLVPERVRQIHIEEVQDYAACPRSRSLGIGVELRGRRRDGVEFPVEVSLNHVQVAGQDLVLSLISDITERTAMEEQARHLHKMDAVGQLAAGVAHEFNNLLTVIMGYTSILLRDCHPDSNTHHSLANIAGAADRASLLARRLLTFGSRQVVWPKWFDLNQHLSQSCHQWSSMLGPHIRLQFTPGEDLGEILADAKELDAALVTLVENARDAMPNGGSLRIETSAFEVGEGYAQGQLPVSPGPYVKLTIADTGMGMTPPVLAHIFEPFFTTKAIGKATGLGLAAVYGMLKASGGNIVASSTHNQGTTFQILLPRTYGGAQQFSASV